MRSKMHKGVVSEDIIEGDLKAVQNALPGDDNEKGSVDVDTGPAMTGRGIESIRNMLYRLQICMAVFGFYSPAKQTYPDQHTEEDKKHRQKVLRSFVVSKKRIYNFCVFALMVTYLVRAILSFILGEKKQEFLILKIVVVTWTFQVTMNVFLMLKGSDRRFGRHQEACDWWTQTVLPLLSEFRVNKSTKWMRRQLIVIFFVGWCCILFNSVSVPLLMLSDFTDLNKYLQSLLISPFPVNYVTLTITVIWNAYGTVAWLLPMVYVLSVSTIISHAFQLSSEALKVTIKNGTERSSFPESIRKLRKLHLNICKLVGVFDKDFHYLFANWFATNLPLACLILYHIIRKGEEDTVLLIVDVYWLTSNILAIATTTSLAASVNSAAHSALEYIHDVETSGISTEQQSEMTLYLSKLNGPQIGFSVLDLVTLTKELMLTIAGLYVTYFFVLWQF